MGPITTPRNHIYLLASFLLVVGGAFFFGRNPSPSLRETHPLEDYDKGKTAEAASEPKKATRPIRCLIPIPSPPLPAALASAVSRTWADGAETRLTVVEARTKDNGLNSEHFVAIAPEASSERVRMNSADFPPAKVSDHQEIRRHRIVEGDTLEQIAQHYYGNAVMAASIFEANRDKLQQPDLLPLGVRLILPSPNSAIAFPANQSASVSVDRNPLLEPQTELVPIQRP